MIEGVFQTADWKKEKHVPVIELPRKVGKGRDIRVTVTVGKGIPHPNRTEHHIEWIDVYFIPEGEKFPCRLGRSEFSSHGASVKGPDTSTVYTSPTATLSFRTERGGRLLAFSCCNIHGLWASTEELKLG